MEKIKNPAINTTRSKNNNYNGNGLCRYCGTYTVINYNCTNLQHWYNIKKRKTS